MTEQEYSELEPMYKQALVDVPAMPSITITAVQRKYMWGYNRASRLLESLAEYGWLKRDNMTGAYSRGNGGCSDAR